MEVQMTSLSKALVSTAIGAGIFAFSTLGASAAVVCNGNVCWHSQERYEYRVEKFALACQAEFYLACQAEF
jgi:hypothetical protein